MVVDISFNARDEAHANEITDAVGALPGVHVRKVSDRTFLVHLGGKPGVHSKVSLRNRDDLSRAYTPGVARVCQAIAAKPAAARRLTIKRNTVAVVTDGSAVLGLGNLGAAAAMPVMEGRRRCRAVAGVDRGRSAWIPRTPRRSSGPSRSWRRATAGQPRGHRRPPLFRDRGGLGSCSTSRCSTTTSTAPPWWCGRVANALRVVDKKLGDCRIVVCGVGAAGSVIIRLLQSESPGEVLAVDIDGIVHPGRRDWTRTCSGSPNTPVARDLRHVVEPWWADVFIGVSGRSVRRDGGRPWRTRDRVALAKPDPEVDRPSRSATRPGWPPAVRTTRTNPHVLAFPGVFRGLLDAHARDITDAMLLAAAAAIANVVPNRTPRSWCPACSTPRGAAVRSGTPRRDPARPRRHRRPRWAEITA